ncbi:MAG: CPBP family intramembrane metalloprotease [Desulfobacteraceae bacterium]|nr:CPBP family intramembrane metalloprotease [Desulfobacteraceae bacterium]MCF8095462.1 CPBP family intramembrane metalloprotease [Desulfobacteraceae bacterium]
MNQYLFSWKPVAATVALAVVLWFATFYLQWGIFWFKISASSLVLAILSFILQPTVHLRFSLDWKSLGIGLLSAAILYLVFWAGKAVSTAILPFAQDQITAVYGKGEGTSSWTIIILLFFVTGPCEEIYWRGYLQRQLMVRFGGVAGWLLATALYAGVHISSGNLMLTAAAGVVGAFWGAMYWRFKDISPVIISHAVWSTFIFAVLPVP